MLAKHITRSPKKIIQRGVFFSENSFIFKNKIAYEYTNYLAGLCCSYKADNYEFIFIRRLDLQPCAILKEGHRHLKKILFIVPYPRGEAPSQRFRFEEYFNVLEQNGYQFQVSSFLNHNAWSILYKKGHFFNKLFAIIIGYLRRCYDLLRMKNYDIIFIHREASPLGPPFFEWMLMRFSGKPSVFDFDDAIWIPNASDSNQMLRHLKRFKNVNNCCRWATIVSAGNKFLADYARQYNKNVVVNPTTIDTDKWNNGSDEAGVQTSRHSNVSFVIGWTGSHSTVQYLDELYPVFLELEKIFSFQLHVICDIPPRFQLQSMKFIKWSKKAEVDDLMTLDVGIMPLPDNVWTRGKCGFKALQYMSLGIPAIVSNVGVNAEIVDHEINGCICKTIDDWRYYLSKLMSDKEYLHSLRRHTKEKVISNYSVQSNTGNFLSLFNSI